MVVPAGDRPRTLHVVFGRGAVGRGGRCGRCRNDPGQARRQPVGAGHRSRRSLVAVALQRGLGRGFASAPVAAIGTAFAGRMRSSRSPDTCLGTLTISGVIGGAVIGIVIVLTVGWAGWVLLLATFYGGGHVAHRAAAQDAARDRRGRGGRRGAGNAMANTGVAAAAAVLAAVELRTDSRADRASSPRSPLAAATRWPARSARRGAGRRSLSDLPARAAGHIRAEFR